MLHILAHIVSYQVRADHYCNSHLYYVVIQEVEYVKKEAKIVYLLECLQKTAPPVIIFCERKSDVDDIHEYLLLKVRKILKDTA
jgi:superfamily II DNA/RNA helicase